MARRVSMSLAADSASREERNEEEEEEEDDDDDEEDDRREEEEEGRRGKLKIDLKRPSASVLRAAYVPSTRIGKSRGMEERSRVMVEHSGAKEGCAKLSASNGSWLHHSSSWGRNITHGAL